MLKSAIIMLVTLFCCNESFGQLYLGLKGYDTHLDGGGRIGDSTSVFSDDYIDFEIGFRGGYRKVFEKSFVEIGGEIHTFRADIDVLDSIFSGGTWNRNYTAYTFSTAKLGLDISYYSYISFSKIYVGIGFHPGILAGKTQIIDEIQSSDYVTNFVVDGSGHLGSKLSKRFNTDLFFFYGLNKIIKYNTEDSNFSFRSRQIGITVNYFFYK